MTIYTHYTAENAITIQKDVWHFMAWIIPQHTAPHIWQPFTTFNHFKDHISIIFDI